MESSAFKPKKLTFGNNSPVKQYKLLETAEKKDVNGFGINSLDDNDLPAGRFSLALHVCMTPKNDTSIVAGSDDEADGVDEFIDVGFQENNLEEGPDGNEEVK